MGGEGYNKIIYSGKSSTRNTVSVMNRRLKEQWKRFKGKVWKIKYLLNVVNAYAPHLWHEETFNYEFQEDMNEIIKGILWKGDKTVHSIGKFWFWKKEYDGGKEYRNL